MNSNKLACFKSSYLLFVAFLLVLPQIITKNMVIGSDAIFHFNRFYETAMQIRHGNFHYYLSLYGFQQSARIVNGFYGPLFAYLQGLLVLIAGSWFRYQVLSNFCLYLLAMVSMEELLKSFRLSKNMRINLSIIFTSTFAIQYWVTRQGFTSWGAALFPWCLIPMVRLYQEGKLPVIATAISLALMVQVHIFSGLLLASCYGIYFGVLMLRSNNRWLLGKQLILAVLLFLPLVGNLLVSWFQLYGANRILPPFINQQMFLNTINGTSYYWVLNPCFLLVFFGGLFFFASKSRSQNLFFRTSMKGGLFFCLLSTSLVPWRYLVAKKVFVIQLIQFPFRFFVPATILLIVAFAASPFQQKFEKWLRIGTVVAIIQMLLLSLFTLAPWQTDAALQKAGGHVFLSSANLEATKRAFYSNDLSEALALVEKATPDYLPQYGKAEKNAYQAYQTSVIERNADFEKRVVSGGLEVSWQGLKKQWVELPIICYGATLVIDEKGKPIDYCVNQNGSLRLKEQRGENRVYIYYPQSPSLIFSLGLLGGTLLLLFVVSKKEFRRGII